MMLKVKGFLAAAVALAFVAVGSAQATKSAAPDQTKEPAAKVETWAGKISDGMCGASKHTMGKSDAECVTACAKTNGYAFVGDKDKVFKIGNQTFADLPKHAGHTVELTGTLKGDTITVTKIAMPVKK